MLFSKYKKRIEELEEQIKELTKKLERATQESNDGVRMVIQQSDEQARLQQVKLDAAVENMRSLQEMNLHYLEKEINSLVTGTMEDRAEFIETIKNTTLAAVDSHVKDLVEDKAGEIIFEKVEQFLTLKIKNAVIKRMEGDEMSQNSLDYIVDTVVKHMLPEFLKEYKSLQTKSIKQEIEESQRIAFGGGLKPGEMTHRKFPQMLDCIKAGLVPMLVGPAGTGKSTAVEQAARVMGLRYYMCNRVANAFELVGYMNAEGKYVPTQFFEAFKNGGVFLFDEVDGSDPEALITINTGIAQGYMAFPCGLFKMHPDFHMVTAGNTYGRGADAEYVGRNKQDASNLDRVVVIDWGYDKEIEKKVCPDKKLLDFAWALRKVVSKNHLKIIISTRGIMATYKLLAAPSFTLAQNIRANLLEGVNVDTLNTIKGGLVNLCGYSRTDDFIKAIDEIIEENENVD